MHVYCLAGADMAQGYTMGRRQAGQIFAGKNWIQSLDVLLNASAGYS